MNSRNFSLAEAAVAAIVVLMLGILLVPVISRMRQASENTACQGNLRQLGTLTLSYSSTNGGLLPALRTSYGVRWSDTLVDFKLGLPEQVPGALAGQSRQTAEAQYASLLRCPASTIKVQSNFGCTYAANPNAFGSKHNPGLMGMIQRPSEIIALGDANQNAQGNSACAFSWALRQRKYMMPDPSRRLPVDGRFAAGNQDGAAFIGKGDSGLRYRHYSNGPTSGAANVLFFDGHVDAMYLGGVREMNIATAY